MAANPIPLPAEEDESTPAEWIDHWATEGQDCQSYLTDDVESIIDALNEDKPVKADAVKDARMQIKYMHSHLECLDEELAKLQKPALKVVS
jgi:hypothetical protein